MSKSSVEREQVTGRASTDPAPVLQPPRTKILQPQSDKVSCPTDAASGGREPLRVPRKEVKKTSASVLGNWSRPEHSWNVAVLLERSIRSACAALEQFTIA